MSIHHKVGNELVEFASHVTFDDDTKTLSINGVQHTLKDDIPQLLHSATFTGQNLTDARFILTDLMPIVPADVTVAVMFKNEGSSAVTPVLAYELDDQPKVELDTPDEGTRALCPVDSHQLGGDDDFAHYSLKLHMAKPNLTRLFITTGSSEVNVSIHIYRGLTDGIYRSLAASS